MTNLLKLFDNMYKYQMNSTRTVGATSWKLTRDAWRTEWNQYTPQQLCCECVGETSGKRLCSNGCHATCPIFPAKGKFIRFSTWSIIINHDRVHFDLFLIIRSPWFKPFGQWWHYFHLKAGLSSVERLICETSWWSIFHCFLLFVRKVSKINILLIFIFITTSPHRSKIKGGLDVAKFFLLAKLTKFNIFVR